MPYTNRYGYNIQAPPDTLMLLSKVSKTVPLAVAAKLRTTVHTLATTDAETMVVPACMPVPETDTPAPIATLVAAKVTLVDALVVVPVAVNTPTGVSVVPSKDPTSGRVLTVLSMFVKLMPGCPIRFRLPDPYGS